MVRYWSKRLSLTHLQIGFNFQDPSRVPIVGWVDLFDLRRIRDSSEMRTPGVQPIFIGHFLKFDKKLLKGGFHTCHNVRHLRSRLQGRDVKSYLVSGDDGVVDELGERWVFCCDRFSIEPPISRSGERRCFISEFVSPSPFFSFNISRSWSSSSASLKNIEGQNREQEVKIRSSNQAHRQLPTLPLRDHYTARNPYAAGSLTVRLEPWKCDRDSSGSARGARGTRAGRGERGDVGFKQTPKLEAPPIVLCAIRSGQWLTAGSVGRALYRRPFCFSHGER